MSNLLVISTDRTYGWHCCVCDTKMTNDSKVIRIDSNDRSVFICRNCAKQLARFFDLIRTELLTL